MTDRIPASDRRVSYTATEGQTVFDIDFPLRNVNYILAYQNGAVLDPEDFEVDLDALTVTLDGGADEGDSVVLEGARAIKRVTGYPLRGGLSSELLNEDIDALTEMMQEARRDMGRMVQLDKAQDGVSPVLPMAAPRKMLRWNDDGTALENRTALDSGVIDLPESIAERAFLRAADESAASYDEAFSRESADGSLMAKVLADGSTVSRLLSSRFSDFVSIKDFGAVGDGETDDTAAFLTADMMLAAGQTIYVPVGTYIVSAITISNKNLDGDGEIKWVSLDSGNTPMLTITGESHVGRIRLDGNLAQNNFSTTSLDKPGVYFSNAPFSTMDRVTLHHFQGCAIQTDLNGSRYGRITRCIFRHLNRSAGIIRSGGWTVTGNIVYATGYSIAHAFRFGRFGTDAAELIQTGSVRGNYFQHVNGDAFLAELGSQNIDFSHNFILDGNAMFKVEDAVDVIGITMVGNLVANFLHPGVYDEEADSWTLDTGTLLGPALIAAPGSVFSCNRLRSISGIVTGSGCIVEGNHFNSCGPASGSTGRVLAPAGPCQIRNNRFEGYRNQAVAYNNANNVVIEDNYFQTDDSNATCITVNGSGHKVRRNDIIGGNIGISIISTTSNATIRRNDISGATTAIQNSSSNSTNIIEDNYGAGSAQPVITISSGAITIGRTRRIRLDTEGGAATDDLTDIGTDGIDDGFILIIHSGSNSRDSTLKDSVGNLRLAGDFTLSHTEDYIILMKIGSIWVELSRSDNS